MLFEQTKSSILDSLKHDLAYFDTTKQTALVTDWSKQGIGFVVLQKHCSCTGEGPPLCCKNGWKLAFCNSRHLQPSESNYARPNKSLAEIDNPRLFNFKEKTLGYCFDIKYIEGTNNYVDMFSRNPANKPDEDDIA